MADKKLLTLDAIIGSIEGYVLVKIYMYMLEGLNKSIHNGMIFGYVEIFEEDDIKRDNIYHQSIEDKARSRN